MIILNDKQLKKLQGVELELLTEIDRICRKNNIEYSLDGGTLLGAIRHKGFIPWDDDADIAITRKEYEKFFEACKKDLDKDKFFLQDYRTDENYRWGYSKLRRNGTILLAEGQEMEKWNNGIFLDIFVYDNVPDNYFMRLLYTFKCFLIRKGQYSTVAVKQKLNIFSKLFYSFLSRFSRDFWFRRIDSLAKAYNDKNTKISRHITFPYPNKKCKYGMPRDCFDDYIDVEFEGKKFKVFSQYDKYLTLLYGDYMTPISQENREPYKFAKLDFGEDEFNGERVD
ncbi:LicD family protein [Kandleria sp.]|jgi:lipopolysaccharide cholinephosphotransferase|uniref:LicD family protein n=1 Tax=Kandleria sp. TaxID=2774291 RepID=UPI001B485B7B|nr:LicD family protein [Kandleria sp.]MBP3275460.1 LicD family protein [Kandleria sp.]